MGIFSIEAHHTDFVLCTYQRPPRGLDPQGTPGICTKTFSNSTYPRQYSTTKSNHCPSPGKNNLRGPPHCNGNVRHRMKTSTNIHLLQPVFHFQDGGDATNRAGLSLCILPRKHKSSPMNPSQVKNW